MIYSIYQVNADDFDQRFLDALKAMFKNKEIEISVYERDETACFALRRIASAS